MSANWIKWCKGLAKKREVVVLASRFKRDKHEIAGRLMALWEWCDDNLDDVDFDGEDAIVSLGDSDSARTIIDEQTGIKGMAEALESPGVDWLRIGNGKRVRFKRFRRHNGKTAKERATEQRKKANQRSNGKPDNSEDCPGDNGTLPGPEQSRAEQSRADESAIATAQCMDRGMQGGKVLAKPDRDFASAPVPTNFADTLTEIMRHLPHSTEPDQVGFFARIAYAEAIGFEWPAPIWDYIGRAKGTRKNSIPNPAGYLTKSLREDLGPERWQEFQDSTPSPAHCQWILAQAGRDAEGGE